MGKIYIIHDTIIWAKAYQSFEFALFAVVEFLQQENESFMERYKIDAPCVMETYDKKDAAKGVAVATLYGEIKIFIKEIDLVGLAYL